MAAPARLGLSCYGKLPFWPEYIEAGAPVSLAGPIKEWLHRGREQASLAPVSPGAEHEGARNWFLIGTPGSADLAVGVLGPSTDAGGLRAFPFVLMTQVPRRVFGREYALAPLALRATWEALDGAWYGLAAAGSMDEFADRLSSFEVPGPAPLSLARELWKDGLLERSGELFEASFGAHLANLDHNMAHVRSGVKAGAPLPALRFPVSPRLEQAVFDSSFWLQLLNEGLLWKRFTPPVFLESVTAPAGREVTFGRDRLDPGDYLLVVERQWSQGTCLRPAHDGGPRDPETTPAWPTYAALLKRTAR